MRYFHTDILCKCKLKNFICPSHVIVIAHIILVVMFVHHLLSQHYTLYNIETFSCETVSYTHLVTIWGIPSGDRLFVCISCYCM